MRMIIGAVVLASSISAAADPPGLTDPHDLAEARYRHVRLHVDDDELDADAHRFDVYRGVEPEPMGSQDFYREVGRADLADQRHGRRVLANASLVGGIALYGLATYELIEYAHRVPDFGSCDAYLATPQFDSCLDGAEAKAHADADGHAWPLIGSAVGMVAAFTIATWLYVRPEPITAGEARALAVQHDRDLRYRMGLVPYVDDRGGGLSVSGAW